MRISKTGKSISLKIDVWWDSEANTIRIGSNDADLGSGSLIASVVEDENKPNGHRVLYRELAKCLESRGVNRPLVP